jgi:hypothetical protein
MMSASSSVFLSCPIWSSSSDSVRFGAVTGSAPGSGGHLRRRGQQRRLADAGLARQQQRRAIGTGLVKKRPEGRQLAVPADQAAGPDVDVQHRRRPSPWPGGR